MPSDPRPEAAPFRVAIVGAGPSGFYAAAALLDAVAGSHVDIYDRLPNPHGLVRSGVAPDHPKLKRSIRVFDAIASDARVTFLGNVTIGRDLPVDQLRAHYHAVIFAVGAEADRALGIPGEDLPGSHTATEFVGWYNGHPDFRDHAFDLSGEVAVVIGQGNVAVDVCRILASTTQELMHTDIAAHALDALADSRIRHIHMIGRRGPAQAKFARKELLELGEMADCAVPVDADDLALEPASEKEITAKQGRTAAKIMEVLRRMAAVAANRSRRIDIRFRESPVAFRGNGRLQQVVLEKNRLAGKPFHQAAIGTGQHVTLDAGIVFRSIGYRGIALPGLPFDDRRGVLPNRDGRVVDGDAPIAGIYATGWIKRGPTGLIGSNKADSAATVASLVADVDTLNTSAKAGAEALRPRLADHGIRVVSYADWRRIDAAEIVRGKTRGKPREKFTRVADMLDVLD